MTKNKKHPCPDCLHCQWCSDDRCRLCLKPCRAKKLSLRQQIELFETLNDQQALKKENFEQQSNGGTDMKLLAISGSLRQGSYNTQLLELAKTCLPSTVACQRYRYDQLPLYNQDLDGAEKPDAVNDLLEALAAADGLLISTPEYNYSLPGGLKNALDWASRPAFNSVLKNKPTAILSASMSNLGGVRAQIHLKQILGGTLTPIFPAPDFLLPLAQQVFAANNSATDSELEKRLRLYLQGFIDWLKNFPA